MNGTDQVIQFILQTNWSALPPEIQHQSKRCLLDTLGALIAGMETPVGRLMAKFVGEQFSGGEATILVSGQRVSAVGAALANGFAANALDIDDGYRRVKGHPGGCILPVLLAAAERRGRLSGQTFLTALIVGYEVGIRAGLIRHALYQTYHSSGSWAAIAGAAAAGKVLGFKADILRQAIGTAEYQAPIAPMMKGIDVPSMGKDSIGWGAMVGMASVLMARQGFTGVEPLFSDAPLAAEGTEWVSSLGKQYEVLNLYFKPYASCRWNQPAIAGALEIAHQYRLMPDDIAQIRVLTFEAATRLSGAHPQNTEEAQYNLAYPVAAALIDGELGPRQVLPPRLFDEAVLALADRVEAEVKPEYEQAFPAKAYADVEVTTLNGQTFAAVGQQASWEPPDTLPTDDELKAKFRWLVSPVLGQERTSALIGLIWQLEQMDDVRQLLELTVMAGH
jgi:2-methylcitrate dehydratase PrpD